MSKKKNQLFDMRLYKEGIRQLRIPGVVSGVILMLCGVLVPLMYMIDMYGTYQYRVQESINTPVQITIGLLEVNGMLWICPYILAALMTILLFRFLNQRNSSDFYHSIPQTRICVAASFLASVFTWVLGLLVGTGLLSCLFAEALPFLTVDWTDVLNNMSWLVTGSILAVGGTFLAVSMTGTIFTNFAVAVMILCVPTMLALVLQVNIVEKLYFVQSMEEMMLYKYNNLTNIVGEIFGMSRVGDRIVSALYTTILGLIYSVLGIYVYQRRSSESAGQSACSRMLKAVFRVVPAFVLSLLPISMIYLGEIYGGTDLFLVVIIYIVAVVVYFLYELFSTGKWKSALVSLKGLWLLAVLNLAVLLVLNGVTLYAKNCIPKAEEIVSVRFLNEEYNYFDISLGETELDSEEIRTFTSDALKYTIKNTDEDSRWEYYDTREAVAIETRWGTLYRYLYITYAQQQELSQILADSEEYRNVYMDLPDLDEWNLYGSQEWKDEDSAARIYQVLKDEIQEMGFSKWYNYVNNNGLDTWVYLEFSKKNGEGYFYLPVAIEVLPNTYKQCVKELRVETDEKQYEKLSELFGKISRHEVESNIWFSVTNVSADRYMGENWIYTTMEEGAEWSDAEFEPAVSADSVEYTLEGGVYTESAEVTVEREMSEDYDVSVYCGNILSQIFAREPMEEGDFILNINGEVYDGEEWNYFQDTWVYITGEEADLLQRAYIE